MSRVFLGGTCNNSNWRSVMEDLLEGFSIDFFNPVVDDWNEEAYKNELLEREKCDFCLYVITPKMTGVYSIAEVIDDSNKRPNKTIFVILDTDDGVEFSESQLKSLNSVSKMVCDNGGKAFVSLWSAAQYINSVK